MLFLIVLYGISLLYSLLVYSLSLTLCILYFLQILVFMGLLNLLSAPFFSLAPLSARALFFGATHRKGIGPPGHPHGA
jgi:hypothetical protein